MSFATAKGLRTGTIAVHTLMVTILAVDVVRFPNRAYH